MERVCPFLKDWDYGTMSDLEYFMNPDGRFTFKRNDWCWLGLWGAHTLYIHASMAADFAYATRGFNSSDMSNRWLDVAVGLVEKMAEDINPINKKIMLENTDINRFLEAQESPYYGNYSQALKEIQNGKKTSHWMWYVFPQFREFAHSSAYYWGIIDKSEAESYLKHTILGPGLREITLELLNHKDKTAIEIFGDIDARKLRSCMTMFDYISPNDIFGKVLDVFYQGERGGKTIKVICRK